jgi:hypothetical protein
MKGFSESLEFVNNKSYSILRKVINKFSGKLGNSSDSSNSFSNSSNKLITNEPNKPSESLNKLLTFPSLSYESHKLLTNLSSILYLLRKVNNKSEPSESLSSLFIINLFQPTHELLRETEPFQGFFQNKLITFLSMNQDLLLTYSQLSQSFLRGD